MFLDECGISSPTVGGGGADSSFHSALTDSGGAPPASPFTIFADPEESCLDCAPDLNSVAIPPVPPATAGKVLQMQPGLDTIEQGLVCFLIHISVLFCVRI